MSGQEPSDKGQKKDTRIKPGEVRNPNGRPRGARSKLGSAFLDTLLKDFTRHGKEAIERTREEKPDQYIKTVASILPKEIDATEDLLIAITGITRKIVDSGGE